MVDARHGLRSSSGDSPLGDPANDDGWLRNTEFSRFDRMVYDNKPRGSDFALYGDTMDALVNRPVAATAPVRARTTWRSRRWSRSSPSPSPTASATCDARQGMVIVGSPPSG